MKTTIRLFCVLVLVVDFTGYVQGEGAWWWPMADVPYILGACGGLSYIGTHSLKLDLVMTAVMTGSALSSYLSNQDIQFILAYFPCVMGCLVFLGVHSLANVWLWMESVAWCLSMSPLSEVPDWQWLTLTTTTLIAAGSVALEFTVASLYQEWQRQLHCNEKLLDGATDGFGVVDRLTGVVLTASPKLLETLESELVGESLWSGAASDRDAAALAQFFGDAARSISPQASLLTWTSESMEFEVRMVPYQLQGDQIGFCVQRLGEKRHRDIIGGAGDTAPDVVGAISQQQHPVAAPLLNNSAKRRPGSLSVSSWSISERPPRPSHAESSKKKVETRTLGVQVDPPAQPSAAASTAPAAKPPAPLAASTVPKEDQARALRKKHLERATKAKVKEGKPHLRHFAATPRSTCGNVLRHIVGSCNVSGKGCCSQHVAWMGVHAIVTKELLQPCAELVLWDDWQCPECQGLNKFDTFPPDLLGLDSDTEERSFQVCALCHELVCPELATQIATPQPSPVEGCASSDSEGSVVAASESAAAASSSEGSHCESPRTSRSLSL